MTIEWWSAGLMFLGGVVLFGVVIGILVETIEVYATKHRHDEESASQFDFDSLARRVASLEDSELFGDQAGKINGQDWADLLRRVSALEREPEKRKR